MQDEDFSTRRQDDTLEMSNDPSAILDGILRALAHVWSKFVVSVTLGCLWKNKKCRARVSGHFDLN